MKSLVRTRVERKVCGGNDGTSIYTMVLPVRPCCVQAKHLMRIWALHTFPCKYIVSCPDNFPHAEGKNSLVNCLFNFCSKRHVRGAPIRLLHANDVTYCIKDGKAVEALCRRLSLV